MTDVTYSVYGSGRVEIKDQWDTRDLEDGVHTLSISAMDGADHVVVQTVNVRTDNNGPEIFAVSLPANGTRVGGTFLIQVEVRDAMTVSEVSYKFDTDDPVRIFKNKETGFYEAEVVTDESGHDLTNGEYTLYVEAADTAGHSTEITRTITVDNSGPQITFTSPSSGQTVDNDVKFRVSVVDGAGVEEVFIRINKGAWMEMSSKEGSDTYTYTWNSRQSYNGEYDVDIRAVDGLGNENEKSATINVDNFPMTIFLIFIIGLVVFLILMVASWRKGPKKAASKGKKEAETPEAKEEEEVPQPPEKAMITELSDDEEDIPPPPMKASMVELADDSEVKEVFECPECGAQLTEFDTICPKCGVELANDEDKLEPPAPEEET
jgi:large-conductance mechanosensitive channel